MANSKFFFLFIAAIFCTTVLFSQSNHTIYLQIAQKRPSINYDYRFKKASNEFISTVGRIGLGVSSSETVLGTKIIKGSSFIDNPKTLLGLALNLTLSTRDQTIKHMEYVNTAHYFLGTKAVLFPKNKVSIEVGLTGSLDASRIRIGWEDELSTTTRSTKLSLVPSAALRFNFNYLMLSCGLENYDTHSSKLGNQTVVFLGLGGQF